MSNEQKLDEVYRIIKQQEARNVRERWIRLIKWGLILGMAIFIAMKPTFILEKITEKAGPTIIKSMEKMVEDVKSKFMENMRNKGEQLGQ